MCLLCSVSATIEKANIYREIFQDKHKTISSNLPLDPSRNNTIKRLLDDGVINGDVRNVLIGLGVNSRGARVIRYVIAINSLDVYEQFLKMWRDVKMEAVFRV